MNSRLQYRQISASLRLTLRKRPSSPTWAMPTAACSKVADALIAGGGCDPRSK
jgi:hypothetical protein